MYRHGAANANPGLSGDPLRARAQCYDEPPIYALEPVMGVRLQWWRAASLAVGIVAISVLRYVTGPSASLLHELSLNLYYIPILVAAYWYGVLGGLLIAVVSSVVYLNRVTEIVSTYEPTRLAEVAVFFLVAITVGLLANAQRQVIDRYREIARMVERANADLRESNDQVRHTDRLRTIGEVATGIAEEIRHPLASIRGSLEIIEARTTPGSAEAESSQIAMSEVRRLDKMVREFLQFARPHEPELRLSSVHDVVTRAVTLLREEADRAGIQLDLEAPATDLRAHIDPLQIEQVLSNVILNAIQATPPGGRIAIHEEIGAIDVCIDVVDQGPGIAPEHHGRIFDPFFTTRGKGTGLGLAIAHRIVTVHAGRIHIAETSAVGTRFRILLPVKGPARQVRAPGETASGS